MSLSVHATVTESVTSSNDLRITSLNQCYDTLFAGAPERGVARIALQSTAMHGGRIERILRFAPDLVLANRFNDPMLVSALRAQGVGVEVLPEPESLAGVVDFYAQLAAASKVGFEFELSDLPPLLAGQRVLMLQANHYSFGADTLWDELVTALGGENVAPGSGLVTVLPEQVLRLDPDMIVVLRAGDFALASRNVLHGALEPLLTHRAIEVDADLVGCMAQRIDDLVNAIAQALPRHGQSTQGQR